jgi:hypothetical protein
MDPLATTKEVMKMIQAYNDIPLRTKIVELTNQIIELQDQNRELVARLEMKETMVARGDHNYFYKGDAGPYCPTCLQKNKTEVLLPAPIEDIIGTRRSCRVCKENYYESRKPPQGHGGGRGGVWS